jgi:hypothetical protein
MYQFEKQERMTDVLSTHNFNVTAKSTRDTGRCGFIPVDILKTIVKFDYYFKHL